MKTKYVSQNPTGEREKERERERGPPLLWVSLSLLSSPLHPFPTKFFNCILSSNQMEVSILYRKKISFERQSLSSKFPKLPWILLTHFSLLTTQSETPGIL
jgi:hypothetical protein